MYITVHTVSAHEYDGHNNTRLPNTSTSTRKSDTVLPGSTAVEIIVVTVVLMRTDCIVA
jgi:hypothetical protein